MLVLNKTIVFKLLIASLAKPRFRRVMANNSGRKIEPIFAWAEYEESHLADHPMPNDFSSPKGSEAPCANRKNSKKVNFPRNEPELIVEPFDMEGDVSPPCKNFSSSKRLFKRRRWKGKKKSSSSVQTFEDKDYHSDNCENVPCLTSHLTPPNIMYPGHVQVCLPPGCLPSEVVLISSGGDTESTPQSRDVMVEDTEVDLWLKDICNQAMTLHTSAQPVISAPASPASSGAKDLERDVPEEKKSSLGSRLMLFVQNQKGIIRRNAICEELEMTMGLVKINGMSGRSC